MNSEFDLSAEPISMLMVGNPGSGKTSLILDCFPNPYILDCDDNLRPAVLQTGNTKFHYDVANKDDSGKMIDDTARGPKVVNRYQTCVSRITEAVNNPDIETIAFDSLGTLSDIIIAEVKRQGSRKDSDSMRIQDWGDFSYLFRHLVVTVKSSGKHFVCTAHNDVDKDEADGKYKKFLYIPGKSKLHTAGLFSNCILLYTDIKGVGASAKETLMVRTAAEDPNDFRGLKDSIGIKKPVPIAEYAKALKSHLAS